MAEKQLDSKSIAEKLLMCAGIKEASRFLFAKNPTSWYEWDNNEMPSGFDDWTAIESLRDFPHNFPNAYDFLLSKKPTAKLRSI